MSLQDRLAILKKQFLLPLSLYTIFTGSERLCFRKNPNLSAIYKNQLQSGKP
jgi:hypothetical protein